MTINAAQILLSGHDPRSTALVCGPDRMTYGALRDTVARAAAAWQARGLLHGDRVAIKLPDCLAWVSAYLGVIWAGGIAVGVNPRIPADDWRFIIAEGDFRFILAESRDDTPAEFRSRVVTIDTWLRDAGRAAAVLPMPMDEDDTCFWTHSSGSTGRPKAVMHPHRFATQVHRVAADLLGITGRDRVFGSSKLFFAYPLGNSLFAGLRLGATVILDPQWPTAGSVAATAALQRPTVLFSVPSLYRNMLKAGVAAGLAQSGLRVCVSAGEALPMSLRAEWQRVTGLTIKNGFGASETLSLVLFNGGEGDALSPTPGAEVESLGTSAEGTPTRVCIRGPMVALGYWKRPDAQGEHFRNGGFSPGDLFERTDDGRWRFAGREDSLVKINGRWVDLVELEERLAACCPDIVEGAAVSVPDADGVAGVAFFYAIKPDAPPAASEALTAFTEKLPHYQRPRWFQAVDALPRTATGKLLRRKLVDLHATRQHATALDVKATTP